MKDNKECFQTTVLHRVLITQVLRLAHDELGHNGTVTMYMLIRRLYDGSKGICQ